MSKIGNLNVACKEVKALHIHLENFEEQEEDSMEMDSSNKDPFMPSHQIPLRSCATTKFPKESKLIMVHN